MKKVIREYQEIDYVKKTKEVFITTDGKEWDDEKKAKEHQKQLDIIIDFKSSIDYTPIDLKQCEHEGTNFDVAFTFIITAEMKGEKMDRLWELQRISENARYLPIGKYLVIQYFGTKEDYRGYDYTEEDGFFGTTEQYIEYLNQKAINLITYTEEAKKKLNL